MYTQSRVAANAYANIGLETGVVAASPHQLILMLFDGAELAVRMAIKHMNEGNIAMKSAAITKASSIILDGLCAALDPHQGGEIAAQLGALYDYMNKRLMLAHIKNQIAAAGRSAGPAARTARRMETDRHPWPPPLLPPLNPSQPDPETSHDQQRNAHHL